MELSTSEAWNESAPVASGLRFGAPDVLGALAMLRVFPTDISHVELSGARHDMRSA